MLLDLMLLTHHGLSRHVALLVTSQHPRQQRQRYRTGRRGSQNIAPQYAAHRSGLDEISYLLLTDAALRPDHHTDSPRQAVLERAFHQLRNLLLHAGPRIGSILMQHDHHIAMHAGPAADGHDLLAGRTRLQLRLKGAPRLLGGGIQYRIPLLVCTADLPLGNGSVRPAMAPLGRRQSE